MNSEKITPCHKPSATEWQCMLRRAKAKLDLAVEGRFLACIQMDRNTDGNNVVTRSELVQLFKDYLVLIDKTGIAVNIENKESK